MKDSNSLICASIEKSLDLLIAPFFKSLMILSDSNNLFIPLYKLFSSFGTIHPALSPSISFIPEQSVVKTGIPRMTDSVTAVL